MIHARIRTHDHKIVADPPVDELRRLLLDPDCMTWLDLEASTPDELELVAGILGWNALTVEDVANEDQRGKLERFDNYAVLVLHALVYSPPDTKDGIHRLTVPEVDFVFADNYVVTVHHVPLPQLTEHREVDERCADVLKDGADYLLYKLTDALVDSYFPVLDALNDSVDELENRIVTSPNEKLLPVIFAMKRDSISLRKAISPQLEIFSRLIAPGGGFVSEGHSYYFRDVHDHIIRVFESADAYRDLMSGALDAYLSTVNNRLSEVMKRLTVIASLFLPLTFFTGLIGMNMRTTPPWEDSLFWVFVAVLFAISVAQYWYFRVQHLA
ncbi:MAG: magnesium transporter CorA family protein [Tepidiformaceae bacterium]